MTKYLKKLSDIPLEEIYERSRSLKSNVSNLRECILKSELEDFEKLKELDFLENLKNLIISRYKLEKRNSFNMDVDKKFSDVWDSIYELSKFLESQSAFYEERIIEIELELKDYER